MSRFSVKALLILVFLLTGFQSVQAQPRLKTKISKASPKAEREKAWSANLLTRYQKFYKNELNNTWNEITLGYKFLDRFQAGVVLLYIQQLDERAYEYSDFWDPEFFLSANFKFDTYPKFSTRFTIMGIPPNGSAWAYKHDYRGGFGGMITTSLEWPSYVIAAKSRAYSYYFGYSDSIEDYERPDQLSPNMAYYYDNGIAGIWSATDKVKIRNEVRLESEVYFYEKPVNHIFHVRNGMGYIINKNVNVWLALDCFRSLSTAESNFEPKNQLYQLSFYWSI